jgi:hypothetical protein
MPNANAYDAFLAVALHTSLEDAQAMHALHTARELRGRYSSAPPAPLRVPCEPARAVAAPSDETVYVPAKGAPRTLPPAPRPAPVVCGVRLGSFPLRLTFEAPHTHTTQARR